MQPDLPTADQLRQQEQDALNTKAALGDVYAFLSDCPIVGSQAMKMFNARQLIANLRDQVEAGLADIRKQLADAEAVK